MIAFPEPLAADQPHDRLDDVAKSPAWMEELAREEEASNALLEERLREKAATELAWAI